MPTCPSCHIGKAKLHPIYGLLPCAKCQKKHQQLVSAKDQVEFTSDSIKLQRQTYRSDYLPMHNRGYLDKGWLDKYGAKKAKQHGFSEKEIKNAKYVWSGVDEYYKDHI